MTTRRKHNEWYWHIHHDSDLAEREDGESILARIEYVAASKDAAERDKRLALMTRVRNQALLNRLAQRADRIDHWPDLDRANARIRKIQDQVVALHAQEHPRCPVAVNGRGYWWMPTAEIFARGFGGRRVKTWRKWMNSRAQVREWRATYGQ